MTDFDLTFIEFLILITLAIGTGAYLATKDEGDERAPQPCDHDDLVEAHPRAVYDALDDLEGAPDRLRTLAAREDVFDAQKRAALANVGGTSIKDIDLDDEVQRDLRKWATAIERVREAHGEEMW